MWIDGIETGVEFENLMIRILRDAGMVVHDTPVTSDYGADLIIELNGHRIAGQCKYYSDAVGVKAVQEVIGALAYYDCDAGVVFTNDTFTQQAINLASANRVLLIDGNMLEVYFKDFLMFKSVFTGFLSTESHTNRPQRRQDEEWTINDLVIRYGVSNQTIMKNFLGYGLPYYKMGREYRFNSNNVFWWEVDTHYVPYGRKGKYALPGYEQYRKSMNAQIKKAKSRGDTDSVRKLKKVMRSHHVSRFSDKTKSFITVFVSLLLILLAGYFVFRYLQH